VAVPHISEGMQGLLKFAHDYTVLLVLEPPDILRMNLLIF